MVLLSSVVVAVKITAVTVDALINALMR